MEECLAYFRLAIAQPETVPPWSEWWAANLDRVQQVFSLFDYVRLKHRRLFGARQILQRMGELPVNYQPPSPAVTGSCADCGERSGIAGRLEGGPANCPHCGVSFNFTC